MSTITKTPRSGTREYAEGWTAKFKPGDWVSFASDAERKAHVIERVYSWYRGYTIKGGNLIHNEAEFVPRDISDLWQVRPYDASQDSAMLNEWARGHERGKFMTDLLPPVGVIAEIDGEPRAAAFMYLCYGVGLGIVDRLFTKPLLSLTHAAEAVGHCLKALRLAGQRHDTNVIYGYVHPAMVRAMKSTGVPHVVGSGDLTQIIILPD
jgi:hypothetical protein